MRILHLSDTHGVHQRLINLPEADIIVHSGDFTMTGTESEAIAFMIWLSHLPYAHKIFICGNHDEYLWNANIKGLDANVHYLNNTGIEIEGIKFYGVPMFLNDCITGRQFQNYANILADTNVVITHEPPYGILDESDKTNFGSEELLQRIKNIQPSAHLFGHIHRHHGMQKIGSTIFSNGAIMKDNYTDLQSPNIIDIHI